MAPYVEELEKRIIQAVQPLFQLGPAFGISGLTPGQIRHAYGEDGIVFTDQTGTLVSGDGRGETIAIVDAYDDPTLRADLHTFDVTFGLPDPALVQVNQNGGEALPGPSFPLSWDVEEALDVEWAHVMAPGASIVLVEANSAREADIYAGVRTAAQWPNVTVVSMSFGEPEFSGELAYDAIFTANVTFVAASGDSGAPGDYPGYSPQVLAVGGTTLGVDPTGNYLGESGWPFSGGGVSQYETGRSSPDVAFDADPATGVPVCDSWTFGAGDPWVQVGGTSLGAPCWAGLIAVINQGRALYGEAPIGGTRSNFYALPGTCLHDVTTGNNGFAAGSGYDLVTGLGTPIANRLAENLAGVPEVYGAIINLYHDVLGRIPDQAGFNAWSQLLGNHTLTYNQVQAVFWQSPEHRTEQISALYGRYLHRQPDPWGLQQWLALVESGAAIDAVELGILSSPEYQAANQ
jgi:subtilase family serine protease